MQKHLILFPLLLSSTFLLGASAKIKWSPEQLASTQKNCVNAALRANPKATNNQASYYCKCSLDRVATIWAYADFITNESKYVQQLGSEGTISKCAREALQIQPNELTPKAAIPPHPSKLTPKAAIPPNSSNLTQVRNMFEHLGLNLTNSLNQFAK